MNFTITITKLKLAVAIVVTALLVPASALAIHSWPDVDDARFYADPVAWAKANGMTKGARAARRSAPTPGHPRRKHHVRQALRRPGSAPALGDRYTKAEVDAMLAMVVSGIPTAIDTSINSTSSTTDVDVVDMKLTYTVTGAPRKVLVTWSGETKCDTVGGGDTCYLQVLVDGAMIPPGIMFVDDSTVDDSWQAKSAQWVSGPLAAGDHTIQLQQRVDHPDMTFNLDTQVERDRGLGLARSE